MRAELITDLNRFFMNNMNRASSLIKIIIEDVVDEFIYDNSALVVDISNLNKLLHLNKNSNTTKEVISLYIKNKGLDSKEDVKLVTMDGLQLLMKKSRLKNVSLRGMDKYIIDDIDGKDAEELFRYIPKKQKGRPRSSKNNKSVQMESSPITNTEYKMNLAQSVGSTIKRLRIKNGLSIREISRLTNCAASHLYNIENGLSKPSLDLLERIADIFECEVDIVFRL